MAFCHRPLQQTQREVDLFITMQAAFAHSFCDPIDQQLNPKVMVPLSLVRFAKLCGDPFTQKFFDHKIIQGL